MVLPQKIPAKHGTENNGTGKHGTDGDACEVNYSGQGFP